jgi:PPK2 family polyphosphate:nucleotide phosphotransferase
MKAEKFVSRLRVDNPKLFRIDDHDPAATFGLDIEKSDARELLEDGVKRLAELQERLYAQGRWSILLILQGMDTSGKDGVIKHMMSGLNPQSCGVHAFKAPSAEELGHHFLWRAAIRVPRRGHIAIFNRSHYEEVLVVRVHPEMLARQGIDPTSDKIWEKRFDEIRDFERDLVDQGTVVIKCHLRISKDEQKQRLLERLDDPEKHWKFSPGDIVERALWDKYMEAYEAMIRHTSLPEARWHVVPADRKWFARLAIAAVLVEAIEQLPLDLPPPDPQTAREMDAARRALLSER